MQPPPSPETQLALLAERFETLASNVGSFVSEIKAFEERLEKRLDDMLATQEKKFVTQAEFGPIRAIVFGLVALICTGFFGAIGALIYNRPAGH